MRPIWTGTIGFGLVNIPVKLFSAIQGSELDLDMLDKKDLSNIKFLRVNEKTGKEVPWANIVKGFMVNSKYVVLEDKDFEAASAVKTKVIEISDFVLQEEINSIYYETPYYIVPEKSGVRAYALLKEALLKSGLELMDDKKSVLIQKIKNIIVDLIHYSEEPLSINFSFF